MFKVWIHVEECDESGDCYQECGEPEEAGVFETEEAARDFASDLSSKAEEIQTNSQTLHAMAQTAGMTLEQIKAAVLAGKTVHWGSHSYRVIRDNIGQWLIKCDFNGSCFGLTHRDGVTLNDTPDRFYTA